jgi:hypothetical protein
MNYWVVMAGVLLIGYILIRSSGRLDEQANEGDISIAVSGSTSRLDNLPTDYVLTRSTASDDSKNQGDNGGEA